MGGFMLLSAATPPASLDVDVLGLRSDKGLVQACVTADPKHFPKCDGDPSAHHLSIPAGTARPIHFDGMPTGQYAVALFHDENGNGRLDTRLGIPIEGVGFSNNPRLWFGPPSFAQARIALTSGATDEAVKLKYFL